MTGNEPWVLTHVGLNTYCDPREEGSLINDKAKQSGKEVVRLLNIDGKDYLLYNNIPMDMCIIRRTYVDEEGNISIQYEAVHAETLAMAQAVHNTGGIVIFEVEQITFSGKYVLETEQDVTYISERCVMKLMITEIAPGIDLEKDILDKMEFKPIVSKDLKLMDERIFIDEK